MKRMDPRRLGPKELAERFSARSTEEQREREIEKQRQAEEDAALEERRRIERERRENQPLHFPYESYQWHQAFQLYSKGGDREQRLRDGNLSPRFFPYGNVDEAIRRRAIYPLRDPSHTQRQWNDILTKRIHKELQNEEIRRERLEMQQAQQREITKQRTDAWDALVELAGTLADFPKISYEDLYYLVNAIHEWIANFYKVPNENMGDKKLFKDSMAAVFGIIADELRPKEIVFPNSQGIEVDTKRLAQVWEAVGKQVEIFYEEDTSDERWRTLRDKLAPQQIVFEDLGIYGKQEDD
jgi:hypothetical protein